ncbi:MAG: efflux RND transporter permease subunit [bacterium]
MNVGKFSIDNRLFVNLLAFFIIVGGVYCALTQRREAFPTTSFDIVVINTVYPGASPKEVEKLITNPIEQEVKEVDGVDEITSNSIESISQIVVKIDPDYGNVDKTVNNIQRAVDRIEDLPDEVDDPLVLEITSEHPAIEVSLSGAVDPWTLRTWVDILRKRLERIPGVSSITRKGWKDPEIWVEVDPKKLDSYQLSLAEVITALKNRNVSIPGGTLQREGNEFMIRTVGEFTTLDEINNVIVRANDFGNIVYIKDIAAIKHAFQEEDKIQKTLGHESINLIVLKQESGDTITVVNQVFAEVNKFKQEIPEGITISFINDISYYIKRRLNVLINNGFIGLVLVVVILSLFLNFVTTVVVSFGVPLSMLSAVMVMRYFDISINLLSMFGLIVVLGMLVDDAIIVAENIYRHKEKGLNPEEAAIVGTNQVVMPVIASVLTTVAAFLPLLFMSGIMGKFVSNIPPPLIIALLASLIESFYVLPSHMVDFAIIVNFIRSLFVPSKSKKAGTFKRNNQVIGSEALWYKKLVSVYTKVLTAALNRRYLFTGTMIFLLAFSIVFAVKVMPFRLFTNEGIEMFLIFAEAPVGTPLETMDERIKPIEELLLTIPENELDTFVSQIGVHAQEDGDPNSRTGSHLATFIVYLTPLKDRKRTANEIVNDLRLRLPRIENLTIKLNEIHAGPPVGKPVAVEIIGDELEVLDEIAQKIIPLMEKIPGVSDIESSYKLGKEEIRVEVDRKQAAQADLNVFEVARVVRQAFEGEAATSIRKTEEEIDVVVKLSADYRSDIETINMLLIPNKQGRLVPLRKVAHLAKDQGIASIQHIDNHRVVSVTAQVDTKQITAVKANQMIAKKSKDILTQYPSYLVNFGGEYEETGESMESLLEAFGFAVFLIFLIIATTFKSIIQPFVIMLTIPFGIMGVIWAFFFHGMPITFLGMLGMVALSGVAVNDSIVLVNFINRRRNEEKQSRRDSIITSGQSRLRPIILTTITTMGGLIPLAYGWRGSDPFLKPMALAIVWGILFATGQTLIIIPCIYAIVDDIGIGLKKLFFKLCGILGKDCSGMLA